MPTPMTLEISITANGQDRLTNWQKINLNLNPEHVEVNLYNFDPDNDARVKFDHDDFESAAEWISHRLLNPIKRIGSRVDFDESYLIRIEHELAAKMTSLHYNPITGQLRIDTLIGRIIGDLESGPECHSIQELYRLSTVQRAIRATDKIAELLKLDIADSASVKITKIGDYQDPWFTTEL